MDVIEALERLAPSALAADWDNVGLLLEPTEPRRVTRVFLTIDLTEPVLDEAIDAGAALIVAYHPPLFTSFRRLTRSEAKHRIALRCIERRMAVYSPHTALDAAAGGVNDWLAGGLGKLSGCEPIDRHQDPTERCKLIVFITPEHADAMRAALSAASRGIGWIGNYSQCSFGHPGEGTFRGEAGSSPVVGEAGQLERVAEIRMEMICDRAALPEAVRTIEREHPYEEPAWDVLPLINPPAGAVGMGRLATLARPMTLNTLANRLKKHLGLKHLRLATPAGAEPTDHRIETVALCPGAGGSVFEHVQADAYLTGEMRHHDVLEKTAAGGAVILTDHTNTERGYLPVYAERIQQALGSDVAVTVSGIDREPLRVV